MCRKCRSSKARGFSLIETIIASGIVAVGLLALAGAFGAAGRFDLRNRELQSANRILTSAYENALTAGPVPAVNYYRLDGSAANANSAELISTLSVTGTTVTVAVRTQKQRTVARLTFTVSPLSSF